MRDKVLVLASLVALGITDSAGAQTKAPAPAQPAAPAVPSAAVPEKLWQVQCESRGKSTTPNCAIRSVAVIPQSRLAAALVLAFDKDKKTSITVQVPLGVNLRSGVSYSLDSGTAANLDVQTCMPQGCIASGALPQDVIAKMRTSGKLTIAARALSGQGLAFDFPLAGFGAAYSDAN